MQDNGRCWYIVAKLLFQHNGDRSFDFASEYVVGGLANFEQPVSDFRLLQVLKTLRINLLEKIATL